MDPWPRVSCHPLPDLRECPCQPCLSTFFVYLYKKCPISYAYRSLGRVCDLCHCFICFTCTRPAHSSAKIVIYCVTHRHSWGVVFYSLGGVVSRVGMDVVLVAATAARDAESCLVHDAESCCGNHHHHFEFESHHRCRRRDSRRRWRPTNCSLTSGTTAVLLAYGSE